MAYHADDTFLPSWGSGMRPREPIEHDESFSGYEEYPPKPKKLGMQLDSAVNQMEPVGQFQPFEPYYDAAQQMEQPTAYGTMTEKVTEKVPELRRVNHVQTLQKSLFLMFWPSFLGTCVVAAFALGYWRHWLIAHEVLLVSVLVGVVMIYYGYRGGWPGRWSAQFMTLNGCCILCMALTGALLGLACFQTYTKSYEIYRGSPFYANVPPGINPGAHRDAGAIQFASGSYVDIAHSIGVRNGDLFCVAPILHPQSNGFSGFWAAGTNCCKSRGTFNCGPVHNEMVRSGLVVLDENYFADDEIPEYTKAAQEAASQFAISMPDKPIFVRWSANIQEDKSQYLHDAAHFVAASAAGIFCFMLVVASSISYLGTGSGDSFAQAYFSVDVYDCEDDEPSRKIRRGRKANLSRPSDPFAQL
jgi:hypothetical protein